MNPFFIGPDIKLLDNAPKTYKERFEHSTIIEQTPSPLALRLGRLLIRMGSKLAHENTTSYTTRHVVS